MNYGFKAELIIASVKNAMRFRLFLLLKSISNVRRTVGEFKTNISELQYQYRKTHVLNYAANYIYT